MKPSGIEWIGDIPDDWKVLKYKYAGRFEKGKLPKFINRENKGSPIIGASEMNGGLPILFTEDSDIPKCRKDDVLFLWDGANAGLVSSGLDGILSSTVVKYVCTNNINIKYLFYLTKYYEKYFKSKVNGTTIPHMSYDFINDCPLLEPPLQTQQRIADYLDEKCGEIDATIAKQKESIEKLKAYKQSLISETVTKGLDKSAPLKPSGIEWIGDIPYDWEIRKVKNTGKLIGGSGFPEEYQGVKDEKIPFIKVKSLAEDPISRNGKDSISESIRSKLNAEKFIKGSVVFAKVGAALLLQRFRILEFDSCIDNNMMGFIPLVIEPRFFKYVTILFDFSYFVNPGTVPSINQEQIGNIKIPFPPLKSQEKIADYLDSKCSQIDKYITEKQNIIQKLDAYKKSLIFECITGKQIT